MEKIALIHPSDVNFEFKSDNRCEPNNFEPSAYSKLKIIGDVIGLLSHVPKRATGKLNLNAKARKADMGI